MLPIFVNYSQANANLGDFELATECKAPTKEFKTINSERKRPARLVFYDTKGGKTVLDIRTKFLNVSTI